MRVKPELRGWRPELVNLLTRESLIFFLLGRSGQAFSPKSECESRLRSRVGGFPFKRGGWRSKTVKLSCSCNFARPLVFAGYAVWASSSHQQFRAFFVNLQFLPSTALFSNDPPLVYFTVWALGLDSIRTLNTTIDFRPSTPNPIPLTVIPWNWPISQDDGSWQYPTCYQGCAWFWWACFPLRCRLGRWG